MQRRIFFTLNLFCFCGLIAADEIGPATPPRPTVARMPPVMFGTVVGRDGAAFGPGILVQGNVWRFGLYGFAGRSSVGGYETDDGVTADFVDRTLGFGLDFRMFQVRRFMIGAFGQAAYYGSHVKAAYFDPDYQMTVEYRSSDRDPLVTIGPELIIPLAPGLFAVVRPGKDFGDNFAAQTANGISISGGALVDGRTIYHGLSKIGKIFH